MAKSILVVDDDPDVVKVLEARLRASGYDVITAGDGIEAMIKMLKATPDLALLDITMPGLDGAELSQVMKNGKETRGIPIIFITGLRKPQEQAQEGTQIAGHRIFAKPFDSKELLAAIAEMI